MIGSFVLVLDKLIQFLNYRREAEDKAFELLITPVFESLRTVHENYLQMFESCKLELEKGTEISLIAQRLLKDRLEEETLRRSIMAFVKVYSNSNRLEKYEMFFKAIDWYFYRGDLMHHAHDSWSSMLMFEIERWVREEQKGNKALWQGEHLFEIERWVGEELKESISLWQGEKPAQAREVLLYVTTRCLREIREVWTEISERYAALVAQRV